MQINRLFSHKKIKKKKFCTIFLVRSPKNKEKMPTSKKIAKATSQQNQEIVRQQAAFISSAFEVLQRVPGAIMTQFFGSAPKKGDDSTTDPDNNLEEPLLRKQK